MVIPGGHGVDQCLTHDQPQHTRQGAMTVPGGYRRGQRRAPELLLEAWVHWDPEQACQQGLIENVCCACGHLSALLCVCEQLHAGKIASAAMPVQVPVTIRLSRCACPCVELACVDVKGAHCVQVHVPFAAPATQSYAVPPKF